MGSMMGGMMGGGMMGGLMGGMMGGGGGMPGDPGGELTAGGGSSGGGGGLLGLNIGNSALGGLLKIAAKPAAGGGDPAADAAATQTQSLRHIVKLVGSAFSAKRNQNRLQLQNQIVNEGEGDPGGEQNI